MAPQYILERSNETSWFLGEVLSRRRLRVIFSPHPEEIGRELDRLPILEISPTDEQVVLALLGINPFDLEKEN